MNLAALARVTRRRTNTNSVNFSDADMADALTGANELVHSRIRKYLDNFRPTAWTSSDVSTGTLTPLFDANFHDLVSLYASLDKAGEKVLPSYQSVLNRIQMIEHELDEFYGARNYQVFTVTIASPGVVTAPNHGLKVGSRVTFVTTGALPTGLSADTFYYVLSAGFTCDTVQVSSTSTGSAINTSGTQSGTHYLASDRPKGMRPAAQNNE
jgi:hypothetical protein